MEETVEIFMYENGSWLFSDEREPSDNEGTKLIVTLYDLFNHYGRSHQYHDYHNVVRYIYGDAP